MVFYYLGNFFGDTRYTYEKNKLIFVRCWGGCTVIRPADSKPKCMYAELDIHNITIYKYCINV